MRDLDKRLASMTAAMPPMGTPPWDQTDNRKAAIKIAVAAHDHNPADIIHLLNTVNKADLIQWVITLGAMVDLEQSMSELLGWAEQLPPVETVKPPAAFTETCTRGHRWTPDSYRIEANGARRCRRCDREYRQQQRRRKAGAA